MPSLTESNSIDRRRENADSGLIVNNAKKSFGAKRLWSGLSFTVPPGKMMAITGPSGSGKSTLLNCIGLLDEFDTGSITLGAETVSSSNDRTRRRFRRKKLGYLFQNYALIDNATVYENLDVATGTVRLFSQRRHADYDHYLERVGLGGRGKELVFRLSGGEQQRVAVARLMAKRPQLVLADEPTGALDPANTDIVLTLLREIVDDDGLVLIATHSREVALACDLHLNLDPNRIED